MPYRTNANKKIMKIELNSKEIAKAYLEYIDTHYGLKSKNNATGDVLFTALDLPNTKRKYITASVQMNDHSIDET